MTNSLLDVQLSQHILLVATYLLNSVQYDLQSREVLWHFGLYR